MIFRVFLEKVYWESTSLECFIIKYVDFCLDIDVVIVYKDKIGY